jgi:hypothetical protein
MMSFVSLTLAWQINRPLQMSTRYFGNLGRKVNLISYLRLSSTGGFVPKVAFISMTASKPVPKAAFAKPVAKVALATQSSDANNFLLKMVEIHGDETCALLHKQRPRVQSRLFEPVEDLMQRQAESDEGWMQEVRSRLETPTVTTLDAINAATTTAIDVGAHPKASVGATTNDDDAMNDQKKAEIIIHI